MNFRGEKNMKPGDIFQYNASLALSVYHKNKHGDYYINNNLDSRKVPASGVTLMFIQSIQQNIYKENRYLFYVMEYNMFTCFISSSLSYLVKV